MHVPDGSILTSSPASRANNSATPFRSSWISSSTVPAVPCPLGRPSNHPPRSVASSTTRAGISGRSAASCVRLHFSSSMTPGNTPHTSVPGSSSWSTSPVSKSSVPDIFDSDRLRRSSRIPALDHIRSSERAASPVCDDPRCRSRTAYPSARSVESTTALPPPRHASACLRRC